MRQSLAKSFFLLLFAVIICCGIYPLALWGIGAIFFPFQANGSLLSGPDGKLMGSRLIAQPFTRNEYFQPRPSAAGYDASASASSSLAASNYALRDRVARAIGPVVRYGSGEKSGQRVGADIESWLQQDMFQSAPHIVAQWASLHPSLAQAWASTDDVHKDYVNAWGKSHASMINPAIKPADLVILFFQNFSKDYPGQFPVLVTRQGTDGKPVTSIEPSRSGADIQSIFFDMWRQDHPDVNLENIPGDWVMTSASGLDPHITLQNAESQLNGVAIQWAVDLNRNPDDIRQEIETILQKNARAPLAGMVGEKFINVLEVNLELRQRYGIPS